MRIIIVCLLIALQATPALAQNDTSTGKPLLLKEVTISKKNQVVKKDVDKVIYDLQADPESRMSTVLDMMRKIPYLSLDAEENVLLGGSSAYKIFINGQPSGILNGNPREVLRSIPASTVKSIEVITNPPTKYDAEGLAGIINIVTLRQTYNGYKGTTNISAKTPVGGPGAGGNFTIKQGKVGLSVIAGVSKWNIPATVTEQKRKGRSISPSDLQQKSESNSSSYTMYGGPEFSYEIDSLNLVSGQVGGHRTRSEGMASQATTLITTGTEQYYKLDNNNSSEDISLETAVNYQHGYKDSKDHLLTVSYLFVKQLTDLYSNIVLADKVNYAAANYRQYNSESLAEHTVQADYMQPVNKLTIEGGIKGIFRMNGSDFRHETMKIVTGSYEIDTTRSNLFQNKQDIFAIYNSYSYQLENCQFKAGVRAEMTLSKGSNSQGFNSVQHQYLNLLPSVSVNKKLSTNSSLSISFSTRIQRPAISELNPFINRSNPNFVSSGNPYLRPITSNQVQLSYLLSARASLNADISCRFFNDIFDAMPTYNAATNITLTRYENCGKGRLLRANFSLNYPITNEFTFAMSGDIRHIAVYGVTDNGYTFNNSGADVYIYTSGSYRFKDGWQVNADITYKKGSILLPVGTINGFTASSVGISKNMLQSKLTLSGAISNPFNKYRHIEETIHMEDFLQTSHKRVYFRRFVITVNYRFGKLKEDIKKNKRSINNDDMGGN